MFVIMTCVHLSCQSIQLSKFPTNFRKSQFTTSSLTRSDLVLDNFAYPLISVDYLFILSRSYTLATSSFQNLGTQFDFYFDIADQEFDFFSKLKQRIWLCSHVSLCARQTKCQCFHCCHKELFQICEFTSMSYPNFNTGFKFNSKIETNLETCPHILLLKA